MKNNKNLLIISLITTISLFIYLTVHHYSVKLGLGGNALCSINSKINCDAAALSSFSEFFNTPISITGSIFHIILLGFVFFYKLEWIEPTRYLKQTVRIMTLIAVATSIVMGLISVTVIKVACPFCVATYLFSFLNLYLGWNYIETEDRSHFDYLQYFSQYKSHLISVIAVPFISWIIAGMIHENFGLNEILKMVPEKVAQWRNSQSYTFDIEVGLGMNKSPTAKATLVEFADFKCPHCRTASLTLDSFIKGHPEVQFIYKPFPLDGTCNTSNQMQKGDGSRCTLAAWALCAEKISSQGWNMHHWIFEHQEELMSMTDLKPLLPKIQKDLQIDPQALTTCADSSETYETIRKSSEEGNQAQVSGTPTIYLNGKKLPYGHIIDILQAAVKEVN